MFLDTIFRFQQENEYLKNAVAKIAAFKPEVLLVEKVVSGLAQEFLYNLGITLVLNVKSSVMDRVSRCCQADIVPSIDAHQLSRPKLGSCRLFHVETLTLDKNNSTKTFMFFDGCQPRLGATVLLRGASHFELRKVKKVLKFMAFACYNGRLERAFLADEFAIPKMLGCKTEIFDGAEVVPNSDDAPLLDSTRLDDNLTFESSSLVIVDSDSLMSPETNAIDVSSARMVEKSTTPDDISSTDLRPVQELDDPLHEYLRIRQGDQSLSSTPIQQPYQSLSIQSSTLATNSMLFRKAMEDTILSISPLIRHPLPFLETEAGRNAPLRKFLPEVLYYSQQLKQTESPPRKIRYGQEGVMNGDNSCTDPTPERNSIHPFLRARITPAMSRTELLGLLSDFRARGVRPGYKLPDQVAKTKLSMSSSDDWENLAEEENQADGGGLKDCLDPFNLQKLCALFSSFCQPISTIAPQYCVAPW